MEITKSDSFRSHNLVNKDDDMMRLEVIMTKREYYDFVSYIKSKQNVCAAPSTVVRSVYPVLADVLADIVKNAIYFDSEFMEIDPVILKEILSKYFS